MHSTAEKIQRLHRTALDVSARFIDSSSILGDRLKLGITSRLLIAFTGVTALVLAANFIVEQGVLVERTTEITRTVTAPVVIPAPATPLRVALPDLQPEPVVVPVEHRIVTSDALTLSIDHFGESLQARVRAKDDADDARYRKAATDMKRAGAVFTTTAASIAGRSFAKVDAALKSYAQGGDAWIGLGDRRRELLKNYDTTFEGLNTRDKASLAGSMKIFGRVLAKQSLLQLSSDLDSLRRHAPAFSSAEDVDAATMAAWLKAEEVVDKDVAGNQASLTRSEGAAWFEAMHGDLVALAALRRSIAETQDSFDQSAQDIAAQATALARLIPARVETVVPVAPHKSKKTAETDAAAAIANAAAATAPELPAIVAPTAPVVETHQTSSESPQAHRRRLQIAWISIGSLLLLSYIAAGTVLSIVRPVRRLLRAAAQLATGDTAVRVERGGINELDEVAVAFNAMVEELAISRASTQDYQQSLELKVTERTRQLQDLAERDPLTDLPNRRQLFTLLRLAIDQAQHVNHQVGVFFLDIDNFKNINDGMGHAFGDRVLVAMSGRLRSAVESFGFAARLGGDEFTVVFPDAVTTEAIRGAGISIVQAFQRPLSVDGRDLIVSVSVGASIYPDHEQEPEALLKAADAALFRAKALGRSQLSVFTPELLEAAAAKFLTEQGLRRAITRGEFELAFQPEVCAQTLQTTLVEALIRWRMPDGSLASPGQFLAIAEESGLIMDISDWVLRSAVETAAGWHHGAWPEARVAINVVPRQLADPGFVERLVELMRVNRLPSRCIEIELTESVLQTGPTTIDALRRLRAHGIAIALDDFGTGYSSLASLEQLPLSRIKLDRSLIASIDSSPRSRAIARAIIAMCQGLGLEITAEGIERPEQFAMLVGEHGMSLQGYLLARPASRDELIPLLALVAQRAQDLLLETPSAPRDDLNLGIAQIVAPATRPLTLVAAR
jgi:diguanylate cyclase (GGDEF)-like protein